MGMKMSVKSIKGVTITGDTAVVQVEMEVSVAGQSMTQTAPMNLVKENSYWKLDMTPKVNPGGMGAPPPGVPGAGMPVPGAGGVPAMPGQ